MADGENQERLSRIQTLWSKLLDPAANPAQAELQHHKLLLRYYGAAFRYLLGIVRDGAVAEELAQDFAIRFLRGDYAQANPERGRFRDFLKAALRNQVRDHWRKQQGAMKRQSPMQSAWEPVAQAEQESDAQFAANWRDELLVKTWEGLAAFEQSSGKPYCTVLLMKTQEPNLRSPELAARLGRELNKTISAEGLRQTLHRARETFADLLLKEVECSLVDRDPQRLEDELIELDLLEYCRHALTRRKSQAPQPAPP